MRSHMRKYDHKVKRKSLFFTLPLGLGPELLLSGFRPTGEVWGTGSGFSGATCWVTGSCFGLDFTLVSISLFFSSGRLSSGRLSLSTESSVFLSSDLLSRSSVWKRNKRDSKLSQIQCPALSGTNTKWYFTLRLDSCAEFYIAK